jgi:murein DD-endopeptidase MepM/ murein hydrolase activator NlpD
MKGRISLVVLGLLLLPTGTARQAQAPLPPREDLTVVRGRVGRNESLATTLADHLSPGALFRLVEAARPVYDLARISVGHPFGLALDSEGLVRAFTYGIDDLRTLRVVRREGELEARVLARRYDLRRVVVSAEIHSSLFEAVTATGERDQLALDLADIFAWDVDFNTELREGDAFRVAVEKEMLDGELVRYGRILAATLRRGEHVFHAVRYEGSRGPGYYELDGTPLRKAFLRSPLRFTRISSCFSRSRLHPILKIWRPHLGVDYAAPSGTPVVASADGVVTLAGWRGGLGRAVRLRHANGYETLYGHLSRIQVRRGQRVRQGERIGAVGQTGLATGPHLDYRMRRDGRFVDPLRIQLPPAPPVPAAEREAFVAARDRSLALLAGSGEGPRLASAAAPPAGTGANGPGRP